MTVLDRILATQSGNLIAVWPLNDASGSTADNAEGTATKDADYEGGYTLDNRLGPFGEDNFVTMNGVSGTALDIVDPSGSTFAGDFKLEAGTFLMWFYPEDVLDLADATLYTLLHVRVDSNNEIRINKSNSGDDMDFIYEANGTQSSITITDIDSEGQVWIFAAMTWEDSVNGDEHNVYFKKRRCFSGN